MEGRSSAGQRPAQASASCPSAQGADCNQWVKREGKPEKSNSAPDLTQHLPKPQQPNRYMPRSNHPAPFPMMNHMPAHVLRDHYIRHKMGFPFYPPMPFPPSGEPRFDFTPRPPSSYMFPPVPPEGWGGFEPPVKRFRHEEMEGKGEPHGKPSVHEAKHGNMPPCSPIRSPPRLTVGDGSDAGAQSDTSSLSSAGHSNLTPPQLYHLAGGDRGELPDFGLDHTLSEDPGLDTTYDEQYVFEPYCLPEPGPPPTPPPMKVPESLQEAICLYIDNIVYENECLVSLSGCHINGTLPLRFEEEQYFHEAMSIDLGFPTPRFRCWLKQFNVDIEVTDSAGEDCMPVKKLHGYQLPQTLQVQFCDQ